jgi:hypothetical protein
MASGTRIMLMNNLGFGLYLKSNCIFISSCQSLSNAQNGGYMTKMIKISLIINIAVLVPICSALMIDADWVQNGYGPITQARGILLSIYLSIAFASIILLFLKDPKLVASLLFVQVVYKLTTPFTVGTFGNPVVISNLLISVFHAVTLYFIWRAGQLFKRENGFGDEDAGDIKEKPHNQ